MAHLRLLAMILANNHCDKAAYHLSLASPALAFDSELNRTIIKTDFFKMFFLNKDRVFENQKIFHLGAERFRFFHNCGYQFEPNALFHSASKKNYNLSKYLVAAGADVNAKNRDPGEENETLLMFVTKSGNGLKYLKLFVESGADIHDTDDNLFTVLIVAALNGRTEFVRYLIEKGADVNARGGSAYLNIYHCVISMPVLKLLFTHGANINAQDEKGETVLHKACQHGTCPYELIEFLLDNGAGINTKDLQRATPFMHAIRNHECSVFTLELLLKRGANIHLVETCFELAICRYRFDAVFLMLKYELEIYGKRMSLTQLLEYCFPTELRNDVFVWMLRNGADINEPDMRNQTPLIVAAKMIGDVDLFEIMIDAGANISHMDEAGHTAFYYAALLLHTKIIKLLARRFGCVLLTKSEKAQIIRRNGLKKCQKLIKTLYKLGSIDQISMEQLKI